MTRRYEFQVVHSSETSLKSALERAIKTMKADEDCTYLAVRDNGVLICWLEGKTDKRWLSEKTYKSIEVTITEAATEQERKDIKGVWLTAQ